MMNLSQVAKTFGHGPKVTTAADATPALFGGSFEWTLYVVTVGTLASTLTYQLQDSEDGTNWTSIDGGLLSCVASSSHLIAVKHTHVRRYTRLLPANGSGNNLGAVTALRLNLSNSQGTRGVDITIGA